MTTRSQSRKRPLSIPLALSVALVLSACDGGSTTGPVPPTPPAPPAPTVPAPLAPNAIATLQVPALPSADPEWNDLLDFSNKVYAKYADKADFIFLVMNRAEKPAGASDGIYASAKNDTKGLGLDAFDWTAQFGSAGKLQGVMYFPYRSAVSEGPSLHELAHRWGNYAVETDLPSHFGFSSAGRQLGGFDDATLKSLGGNQYQASITGRKGFGTYANGGNSVGYSDVELYLMGLLPPSEVQPFHVATGAQWIDVAAGTFSATTMTAQTVDDIIKQHGARTPDHTASQKEFHVLTVLVSTTTPTESDLKAVAEQVGPFAHAGSDGNAYRMNFYEATRGKGTLQVIDAATALK